MLTVVAVVIALACASAVFVAAVVERRARRRVIDRLAQVTSRLAGSADHHAPGMGGPAVFGSAGDLETAVAATERAAAAVVERHTDRLLMLDRLAQALSAVGAGVVVCDEHGSVQYRNQAAAVFSGARHGDALAEVAVTDLLSAALHHGPAEQQLELYGPPRRALLISARPLYDDDRTVGAVAIIEDISERRRLDAVRRDFVANVSHELKTPVGALGILAETLQAEDDSDVSRRLAQRMHIEAFRVARIIDDLLDLSRIESEEAPHREPVAVHVVVAEAVERIRPMAEHREITIEAVEAPKRLTIVGDRRQLVSALHNLLENAVKYSDDSSSVQVDVRAVVDQAPNDSTWVEIAVVDHGIGIPARDLERIFERFYRVDRARARDTGGTGLGLAIVRHVAHNHKGEVRVLSHEGEGSTFTLRLPAGPGPVAITTSTSSDREAG